jgi:citrate lyase beta subunit
MSVAFVREESAEAAQEVGLPPRAISPHPNFVTQSGLRGLEHALADSQQALKAAQAIADANDRRRALELAARDYATSGNASRAQFRSLNRVIRSWSRSAPRSRSCATIIAARRSGS